MIQRVLTGWNFGRVVYLVLGLIVVIQSAVIQQWLGIVLGGYFASMGLFAFGCASGNCFGENCKVEAKPIKKEKIKSAPLE